jgi:hypothetical protein
VSNQVEPLIDVREDEQFLGDKRDVEAALIYARRFGQSPDYKNRGEANAGADALKGLKDVKKAADEGRKKVKAPYEQTGKHIDGHYKEALSPVDAAIAALDAKGVRFLQRERQEREDEEKVERNRLAKEAEEKAAAAAEAARKAEAEQQNSEAQRAAAKAHNEAAAAAVAEPVQKKHPKQLRGDIAAFGTSTTLDWEVTDLSKVPAEHLTFNKKSIDAAVKAEKALAKAQDRDVNLQCIPGVRVWFEETGVSRGPRS